MKKELLWLILVLVLAALTKPGLAHATFILDADPGGAMFFLDMARDATAFTGHVGGQSDPRLITVSASNPVDVANGYATIKPADDILTSLTFTPADATRYGDFSFRGQLENGGSVFVDVIDQLDMLFHFAITDIKHDTNFSRIGVISPNGDWIKSVIISTGDTFKQVKQIEFSATKTAPVPEPGTMVLLGAGLFVLGIYWKRRRSA